MQIEHILCLNSDFFIIIDVNGYVYKLPNKIAGKVLGMKDEEFKEYEVPLDEYEEVIRQDKIKFLLIDYCDESYNTVRHGRVSSYRSASCMLKEGHYLNLSGESPVGDGDTILCYGKYHITESSEPKFELVCLEQKEEPQKQEK